MNADNADFSLSIPQSWEKWLLVGLLLLAFGLRIVALDNAPPGLRYDELQNYVMAGRVMAGERPLYFAESWGHEPLYHYLQAFSLSVLGESDWSLRLPSVALSLIALTATWVVAKKLLGSAVALLSLVFLTFSFWGIFYGRVGLRVGGVTAFAALMIFFMWRCWERPLTEKWRGLSDGLLAGVFLAAGVYTYLAGRVLPAILVGFVLFTAVLHWQKFKRRWPRFTVAFVAGGLLCWPLWQAIAANPTGEQRLALLNQAIQALRQGDPLPVLDLTVRALGMYVVLGEQDWLYNVYGRPIFGLLTAVFFLGGLGWGLWRWRNARFALLLLWFFGGTGPSMIAPPAASVTHSIVAQPVAYIFLGWGLTGSWRWLWARQRLAATVLLSLVVIATGVEQSVAYFITWNQQEDVGELYQVGVTAVADAIRADESEGTILIGGPYINYWQPWNQAAFDLAVPEDVSYIRWFNPAGSWVWPAGDETADYYFPINPLAGQQFSPLLTSYLSSLKTVPVPGGNFVHYQRRDSTAWNMEMAQAAAQTQFAWPPELATLPVPNSPLSFAGQLALWGTAVPEETIYPGATVQFRTYWQVTEGGTEPVIAFVHLTQDGVDIWGQQDWLDVRVPGLQPGDRFVQVHEIGLRPDAPPGIYHIQLGLYHPGTGHRLPIQTGVEASADRVWVGEIRMVEE